MDVKFHRWLLDAQDFRNTGDYGIGASMTSEQAGRICDWAREFIKSAQAHLASTQE